MEEREKDSFDVCGACQGLDHWLARSAAGKSWWIIHVEVGCIVKDSVRHDVAGVFRVPDQLDGYVGQVSVHTNFNQCNMVYQQNQ